MAKVLGLDLISKKQRRRTDYPYHEDYRTRWYAPQSSSTTSKGKLNPP